MGGVRVESRGVFCKILCCDDDCGKLLGYGGENKRKYQEELKVDIKVSVKRPGKHTGRCISIATPDNRAGAIKAIEQIVCLMTENKPASHAQIRLIVSDYQAQAILAMANNLFNDFGATVQATTMGEGEAAFIVHPAERVLEIMATPGSLQFATMACGEIAWECGDRMLPTPEDAAPAGPPITFHLPDTTQLDTSNQGEKVQHQGSTLPTRLTAVAGPLQPPPALQDVSPASSDTGLNTAAFVACQLRFRLVLPQELIMQLMSKRGAAVCRLQAIREEVKHMGCTIQLHDRPKDQPKTSLRCLEITGNSSVPEAKLQAPAVYAARQICSQLQTPSVSIILAVPRSDSQAGAVIGKGGDIINGIRAASRAKVRVIDQLPAVAASDVPAGVDVGGDEFIMIEGNPAAAEAALQSVLSHLTQFQETHRRDGSPRSPDISCAKRHRSDESAGNSPVVDSRSKRHCSHLGRKPGSPGSSNASPKRPLRASECAVLKQTLVNSKQKNVLMECKAGGVPPLEQVRRQLASLALAVHIKLDDARRPDSLRRLEIGGLDHQTVQHAVNSLNLWLHANGQDNLPELVDVRAK